MAMLPQTTCTLEGNKPRVIHGTAFSEVFAYPSSGGHVRKYITAAELEWLGLKPAPLNGSYNENTPIALDKMHASNDPDDEDAFALQMLHLGGRWWQNQKLYKRHFTGDVPYGHHYPPDLDVGYTSHGILVLRTWAGNSPYFDDLSEGVPEKPETWSRLALCATMEERCKVLEDFGAVMYSSVEECPDLPSSLDEGIADGMRWAELLRKMEDPVYRDQWLCSL